MHAGQNRISKKMTLDKTPEKLARREVLGFVSLFLKPLVAIVRHAIFSPASFGPMSILICEIYSRLWDFAEHSISHQDFTLPSAVGTGPVHKVNDLLCRLYGAKFSSLSFGGSSGAMLTILTAVLPKLHPTRDLILFDDVCHQSTIGGLIFGRWKAVRLVRQKHPEHQTPFPLTFDDAKRMIERHGRHRFAAIILVLPSYDGYQSPSECRKIYEYAQSHGITVIVDGAWDSLRFRRDASLIPALSSICDIWISSPHKRGLTPSSLGCILTDNESIARFWDEALELGFRSSSVSFVELMIAEYRLSQVVAGDWNEDLARADNAARRLHKRITDIHPDLYVIPPDEVRAELSDPNHILISTHKIPQLDAREWADTLSSNFGLDVEKATTTTILLLCASPDHINHIDHIVSSFKQALTQTLTRQHDQD